MMQQFVDKLLDFLASAGIKLVLAAITMVIGWLLVNFFVKKIKKNTRMDNTAKAFFASFVNFGGKALIVILAISVLGVKMTSIVAIIASVGLTIGLALQGSLSNIAGGILLVIFKPFKVGDYVAIATNEGTVKDMNLFYTILRTQDNKTISIPNATVSNTPLRNLSIEPTRRVDFNVDIPGGNDIDRVKKLLIAVAANHEDVLEEPSPSCRLAELSSAGAKFTLNIWTKKENYRDVMYDINEAIEKAFRISGITISKLSAISTDTL